MKKLLVLTASTSLPRPEPEVLFYEQTWPAYFSDKYQLFQGSKGGSTSLDLCNIAWYLKMFRPDIVIIQAGLVDCAPRAFTQNEIIAYNYFWVTRYFFKVINKYFGKKLRNLRHKSNLSVKAYKANIIKLKNAFTDTTKVYAISILLPNDHLVSKNKHIREKVIQYNKVLKEIFGDNYIDVDDFPPSMFMSDGQHPRACGHKWLYERISSVIERGE